MTVGDGKQIPFTHIRHATLPSYPKLLLLNTFITHPLS